MKTNQPTDQSAELSKLDQALAELSPPKPSASVLREQAAKFTAQREEPDTALARLTAALNGGLREQYLQQPPGTPIDQFLRESASPELLAELGLEPVATAQVIDQTTTQSAASHNGKSAWQARVSNWLASVREGFSAPMWVGAGGMVAAALIVAVVVRAPENAFAPDAYLASNAAQLEPLLGSYPGVAPGFLPETGTGAPQLAPLFSAGAAVVDIQVVTANDYSVANSAAAKRLVDALALSNAPADLIELTRTPGDADTLLNRTAAFYSKREYQPGYDLGRWARKAHLAVQLRLQGQTLPDELLAAPLAEARIAALKSQGLGSSQLYGQITRIEQLLALEIGPADSESSLSRGQLIELNQVIEELFMSVR